MEGNEGSDDEQVEEGNQDQGLIQQLNEDADAEFNRKYSYIDMAMGVAKEVGVSYFEIVERSAIEVLMLTSYLMDKVKKLERDHKNNGRSK